jgi:uncharacterized phage protein gp47/JayE
MTAYDLYLYQGYQAQQLFATTATDGLPIHSNIWGVPRLQPTAGTGNGGITSVSGAAVDIPQGTLCTLSGASFMYITTAAASIPAGGGTVSLPLQSVLSGTAYNLPGGTVLNLVSPIAGVQPQAVTLDSNGIANGTDIESITSWQARIVARIQNPPGGGTLADYERWAEAAGAAYVNVVPGWVGAGSVGVIIAAPGPAVASTQLVAAVQAYINQQNIRPITARVVVVAATLVPVDVQYTLNPDTTATEAAALNALQLFYQQSAQIGSTVFMSRQDNAVSSGSGAYSFERIAPTADVVMTNSQLAVLGTVSW